MDARDRQMLEKIDNRTEKIMEKTGQIRVEQATQANQIKTLFANDKRADKEFEEHEKDNKDDFEKQDKKMNKFVKFIIGLFGIGGAGGGLWEWLR